MRSLKLCSAVTLLIVALSQSSHAGMFDSIFDDCVDYDVLVKEAAAWKRTELCDFDSLKDVFFGNLSACVDLTEPDPYMARSIERPTLQDSNRQSLTLPPESKSGGVILYLRTEVSKSSAEEGYWREYWTNNRGEVIFLVKDLMASFQVVDTQYFACLDAGTRITGDVLVRLEVVDGIFWIELQQKKCQIDGGTICAINVVRTNLDEAGNFGAHWSIRVPDDHRAVKSWGLGGKE